MSVTFYSNEAPKNVKDCYECQCAYDGLPDADCTFCDGNGVQTFHSSSLEVQMSNANARDVLEITGLPTEDPLVGGLDTIKEISDVKKRIIRILNSEFNDPAIEPEETGGKTFVETNDNGIPEIKRGTRIIYGGRKKDYIRKRLFRIKKLCQAAIRNKWTVTWS